MSVPTQLARAGAISPGAAAEMRATHGARLRYHWYELKEFVIARDENTCQICGRQGDRRTLQIHHIVPIQWGGSSSPDNLATLCPACHHRLHAEHRTFRGRRTFEDDEGAWA